MPAVDAWGAVRSAERVVHVDVRELCESGGECVVVVGLAGVEAEILEQQHVAVCERADGLLGLGPHAVACEGDWAPEQLAQARRHGC